MDHLSFKENSLEKYFKKIKNFLEDTKHVDPIIKFWIKNKSELQSRSIQNN